MAGLLDATIRRWASTPCNPFPCGEEVYVYACGIAGVDPEPLPQHKTRQQVAWLLREKGGLINYAGSLVEAMGWSRLAVPGDDRATRGDVGVVTLPGMGATCAICLGDNWAAKGDGFVLIRPALVVSAAWRY